jgi:hypothetical protein
MSSNQPIFTGHRGERSIYKPPRRLSGGNINQKTIIMQNKPNLSLRRQGSSSTITLSSARRYKNFTRHSVSEGGPIQTQSKPKTNPFLPPKTAPKPKTNPNFTRRSLGEDGQTQLQKCPNECKP